MIVIKGARTIDPFSGLDDICDIFVVDGKIEKICRTNENVECGCGDCQVIDAKSLIAAPGFVDVHVHFRDPGQTGKEDIFTGALAAAAGGYTSVVCMANTSPAVDSCETLSYCLEKGRKTGIHIYQNAAVTKSLSGQELVDMDSLCAAGAAGFSDDGKPILSAALLRTAMQKAKSLGLPVSLHEEDPAFIKESGVNMGVEAMALGISGANPLSEYSMVARDCMLALETGAKVNIQHISSAVSVELVRLTKRLGADIHAEATPHHFSLTQEAVRTHGTLAKMNPPLRTEADREAIWQGLADGTIDIIATDHAPHMQKEKERDFCQAPSGITGLETALSLATENLADAGIISWMELINKMSLAPATLYGLPAGRLCAGGPADIVLFDRDMRYVFDGGHSKSRNSPFIGRRMKGRVLYTICSGKIVYTAEER